MRIQSPKILSYLKKDLEVGQRVFVRGELRSQTYKNSNNKLHQSLQGKQIEEKLADSLFEVKTFCIFSTSFGNVCNQR